MEHDPKVLFLLVHRVARAFYDPKVVVLLDALARSRELTDADLSYHLHLPNKKVRSMLASLISQDKFIIQITKTEMGTLKAYRKVYYFLNFQKFVQAVKYKMIRMQKTLSDSLKSQHENDTMHFVCKLCGRKFSMVDAVNQFDPKVDAFVCHGVLEKKSEEFAPSVSNLEQKKKRLNDQIKPLLELAKETDNMKIPIHITSVNNAYLKPNSRYTSSRAAAANVSVEESTKKYSFQDGQTPVTILIIDEEANKKEEEKKILPLPWFQKIQTMFDDDKAKKLPNALSEDDLQNSQASTEQGDEEKEDLSYLDPYYDNLSRPLPELSEITRARKRKFDDTESVEGSEMEEEEEEEDESDGDDNSDQESDDEFEDVEDAEESEGEEDDEEEADDSNDESEMAVDTPSK